MITPVWRRFAFVWIALFITTATVAHADEIWIAPTYQQDIGGLGVASSAFWPVTAAGVVRLALAVPNDLNVFQSAKVALIPSASAGGPAAVHFYICTAQNGSSVTGDCTGPFVQTFPSVANQLIEVEIGGVLSQHIGTPGANYLAIFAYTTPAIATDHIVGLRFSYAPITPAGVATLAANTFTGTQTAPAFVGDGSGLTHVSLPNVTIATDPGSANSFVGLLAGASNTSGFSNSFFGYGAGSDNTQGSDNSFFGYQAGERAGGSSNAFFGIRAGRAGSGSHNSYFGNSAGSGLLAPATGSGNSFFGDSAGWQNVDGSNNAFFGVNSGYHNVEGSNNTLIGPNADVVTDSLTNATAIGANAAVSQSNSLVLGSINGVNSATADTKVGIGTTAPASSLHVNGSVRVTSGSVYVSNPNTLIITSPNGACWGITVSNAGAVGAFSTPCPP